MSRGHDGSDDEKRTARSKSPRPPGSPQRMYVDVLEVWAEWYRENRKKIHRDLDKKIRL